MYIDATLVHILAFIVAALLVCVLVVVSCDTIGASGVAPFPMPRIEATAGVRPALNPTRGEYD